MDQRVATALTMSDWKDQPSITPPTSPLKSRVARMSPNSPASLTSSTRSLTISTGPLVTPTSSSETASLQASTTPSSSSLESSLSSSSFDSASELRGDAGALQLPILGDGALVDELLHLMVESVVVDDFVADQAFIAAKKKRLDFAATSSLTRNKRQPMPLAWEDVKVEKLLGVGGFCCATLASIPKLEEQLHAKKAKSLEEEESDDDENDSDTDSAQPQLPHSSDISECPRGQYALKCLNRKSVSDSKKFVRAAQSLAYEASILSCLDHENIIQIHGVCSSTESSTFRRPGGYFLVLQCMRWTLDDVLKTWQKRQMENSVEYVPDIPERLRTVALGVAKGMAYLHENNILFRDIKPHNIGIDYEGNPRIFDFGISKELPALAASDYDANGRPTKLPVILGCVGSLRYMAPEVLVQHRASYPSDVYSFAVLLCQICSLKKPYGSTMQSTEHFRRYVGMMKLRPFIPPELDVNIKRIVTTGWHQEPYRRPSFPQIIKQLEKVLDGSCASKSSRSLSSASNQLDYTSRDLSSQSSPKSHRRRLSKLISSFLKPKKRTVPVSS